MQTRNYFATSGARMVGIPNAKGVITREIPLHQTIRPRCKGTTVQMTSQMLDRIDEWEVSPPSRQVRRQQQRLQEKFLNGKEHNRQQRRF